jgi:hypothetical protein
LTLFLAANLIIVDLVAIVYKFIDGEISARFFLKAASILIVSGPILIFYRGLYQRTEGPMPPAQRVLGYATAAAVAVAIIAAFFVAGSPHRERMAEFDRRKVQNLITIQEQVVSYWRRHKALPASLDDLSYALVGFTTPHDPQSNAAYGYRKTGTLSFELCADFNLPAKATEEEPGYMWFRGENRTFDHGAGHICFARTIDPSRYDAGLGGPSAAGNIKLKTPPPPVPK